jgi:hypothetical protein
MDGPLCISADGLILLQTILNRSLQNSSKYLVFVSSRSVKLRELSFARLFGESVFVFQFLNDKIHNYVKQNIKPQLASHAALQRFLDCNLNSA